MAIFKCKMCGGDLNIEADINVVECEYCGTTQTVPVADNEKKMSLFARANKLRAACDFDKAAGVYESIVTEFPEEAESYWGLILCTYGIEYVDDPATGKKIPTCHRSSFDSILDSSDFEMVMENADSVARKVYRDEAKAIEELRKSIIEISGKEEPYDIFICYKETAENGDRTIDSVIAQDVYNELTAKGYRVFFSRITLEDKLGQEYEPYIFAALNSAKVMLAFGTDYEYYNAVWVKNEWSRFLQLIAKGEKKTLIPCYKNIDAYDMPKEFAKLQAQDMGKVGAIQDLLRGIEKIIPKNEPAQIKETVVVNQSGGPNVDALLKRGNNALEDGEWNKAKEFFEQVLNMNAECAEAYLGLAMANNCVSTAKGLILNTKDSDKNYLRAKQYADKELLDTLALVEEEKARKTEDVVKRLQRIREKLNKVSGIIEGGGSTIGLKSDGTVVATKYTGNGSYHGQCDVGGWTDIVAVSTSFNHTVGLKSDGTVIATKYKPVNSWDHYRGQCDVTGWSDIVAISAGDDHTVGLKSDGSMVATGFNDDGQCDVARWIDITAVSAGAYHTVGLKSDGTVMATKYIGSNQEDNHGQCDVSEWTDIVAISAGAMHTVGLKSDGTVVATKYTGDQEYYHGQCDVSRWTDIVAVSAGGWHTVGLKSNGTVVATKYIGDQKQYNDQCDVASWRDIVAVSAGSAHTVGLKSDGTIVTAGYSTYGQCSVDDWKLFDDFDNLEEERKVKMIETKKQIAEKKRITEQKAAYRSQGLCQHCGGTFKGLFTKKCSSCGKEKDY